MAGNLFNKIYFSGPLQSTLALGATGALLGRYVGAPLANLALPELQNEEDKKRRKKELKNIMTFIGAIPGLATGAGWIPSNIKQYGIEGLYSHGVGSETDTPYNHGINKSNSYIPTGDTISRVLNDPFLSPVDKQQVIEYLTEASGGETRGLISTRQLINAGVGAGLGYAGANVVANTVGAVFGLQPSTKAKLGKLGLIAGLLYGSGIAR